MSKVALVSGGASGIGLGITQRLLKAGHRVAALDLATTDEPGVLSLQVDVTDRAAVDAAVARVRTELGPVAICVTSAGIDATAEFTELTLEQWDRVLAVNLTGTFNVVQSAVADMIAATWGRIVTISSQSAQSGAPGRAHYVASKGGVIALTKALAIDLARHGITANTIPPSIIDTPMLRASEARGLTDVGMIAQMTLVGRIGTPDDIAAATEFLVSDDAGFITGQQIGVNGGWRI